MDSQDRRTVIDALAPLVSEALRRYERGEYPVVLRPYMEPRHDGVMHSSTVGFDAPLHTRRCMDQERLIACSQAVEVLASVADAEWPAELEQRSPKNYGGSRALEAYLGIAGEIVAECTEGALFQTATEAALARFERFCALTQLIWTVRAPLAGVSVAGGPHALSDKVVVRTADDEFKKALWAAHGPGGDYWSTFADDEAMVVAGLDAVLETTFATERDGWPVEPEAMARIEAAITALRIHGARHITVAARWTQGPSEIKGLTRAPSSSLSRYRGAPQSRAPGTLSVDVGLALKLREWIEHFDRRPLDDALSFAVQRFNLCDEHERDDDRLVDAWIALESLFSTSDERDEITYRIALRLATLLGKSQAERKTIRELAKLSYGLRSRVVHGTPRAKRGKKYHAAARITNDTEDLLRRTFRLWVHGEYGEPEDVIAKLEDQFLSGPPLTTDRQQTHN